MKSESVLQINRYIYIDTVGLDSLWAQATARMELETETTNERGRAGKLNASLGLGRALGAFLGLADVKGAAEAEMSSKAIDTTRSKLVPEQKLKRLTRALLQAGPPTAYDSFDAAATAAEAGHDAVFVLAKDLFDAPQFYDAGGDVLAANSMGALLFERNLRPDGVMYFHDDGYFRKRQSGGGAPIVMAASLRKWASAEDGVLRHLSHEAVMLRACRGVDVQLGVFGSLFQIPGTFQIKPFAIWV